MGDDDGFDTGDLGGLLFGYLVYREIRDGRLDADGCLRAGCLVAVVVGVVLGGLLLLAGLATPRYGGGPVPYRTPVPLPAERPAIVVPAAPAPTPQPSPTLRPTPTPTPAPTMRPSPLPGIGTRVPVGGGWAVTVTKAARWRPASYSEPGWRLVTVRIKVRMPAVDIECVFPSSFWLEARSGRTYPSFEWPIREPQLFDCADYHRPTTADGWVTFEVRDADAKGLVLATCVPSLLGCEEPARIRLR